MKEERSTIGADFDDEIVLWDPDENPQDGVVLVRRDTHLYHEDGWPEYIGWFTTTGE